MKIKSWWSEDRKWLCVLVDDGICQATVSLTPEEADAFIKSVAHLSFTYTDGLRRAAKKAILDADAQHEESLIGRAAPELEADAVIAVVGAKYRDIMIDAERVLSLVICPSDPHTHHADLEECAAVLDKIRALPEFSSDKP